MSNIVRGGFEISAWSILRTAGKHWKTPEIIKFTDLPLYTRLPGHRIVIPRLDFFVLSHRRGLYAGFAASSRRGSGTGIKLSER